MILNNSFYGETHNSPGIGLLMERRPEQLGMSRRGRQQGVCSSSGQGQQQGGQCTLLLLYKHNKYIIIKHVQVGGNLTCKIAPLSRETMFANGMIVFIFVNTCMCNVTELSIYEWSQLHMYVQVCVHVSKYV